MQESLNKISVWCKKWKLSTSPEKSSLLNFSRKRSTIPTLLKICDKPIPEVKSLKILGIIFDPNITWKNHINYLRQKGFKYLNAIKTLSSPKIGTRSDHLLNIINATIRSIFDYGSQLFSFSSNSNRQKLEPIYNAALRLALGLPRNTPLDLLRAESMNGSINSRHNFLCQKFITKQIALKDWSPNAKVLNGHLVGSNQRLVDVRKNVREAYGSKNDKDIVNIGMSYDGSWLTRGHTLNIGVGCVIDLLTGFVIDYEVMSKRCGECEQTKFALEEDSTDFRIWYEGHQDVCSATHVGSSGAMEVNAAVKLWERSESIGFRYTTLLSDGDSKSFLELKERNVYGSETQIKKEECINHVSKRLGTALRQAVKDWRVKGVTLGGKQRGCLKEETIKKLTRYYTNAIRKNKDDVEAMKTAIYATLFHCMSTDQKPQHKKCPSASSELLSRCVRGVTQNSNEALHWMIWNRCSKENSASRSRVLIAVSSAISEFNVGTLKALKTFQDANCLATSLSSEHLAFFIDYRRTYFRKKIKSANFKVAQQKFNLAKLRRLKIEKNLGPMFKFGGF
ncbi:uncharacterized protein TNCV_2659461 [Trichonephila clavipes]|uniref:Mutator-like transposase domain-containing protein n=1 Tax=Trichonephila clavipes TaxID=2585209 RepID=A0A8X6R5L3_TRICX|nr:uncharacterized protein TNCV_2659461 [Trichonephila clavipes]